MNDFKRNTLPTDDQPQLGEVLFEIAFVGNAVKVSAIDPVTNTEVSVMGSPHMTFYTLKINAIRKLKRALIKLTAKKNR